MCPLSFPHYLPSLMTLVAHFFKGSKEFSYFNDQDFTIIPLHPV